MGYVFMMCPPLLRSPRNWLEFEFFLTATSIPPVMATCESPTLEEENRGMKKEIITVIRLPDNTHPP